MSSRALVLSLVLLAGGCSGDPEVAPGREEVWVFDNLESIGGHRATVVGAPRVIDAPGGKAVAFDGRRDALFVERHPLAGARKFTAEVIFRPYADGEKEQRFLHMQEDGSEDRVMFEIRLTDDGRWFMDAYVKSGGQGTVLFAKNHEHPIGDWYHAAIVVDGEEIRNYVNGVEELSKRIAYAPQRAGRTSIGSRINEVSWFKGAVRKARFTPSVLPPEDFLAP